jgi:Holliday junction resolvasome RuvABC endonuclease subunit
MKKSNTIKKRKKDPLVRMFSIDPALSILGWSVLDVYEKGGPTHVIAHGCYKPVNKINRVSFKPDVETYGRTVMLLSDMRTYIDTQIALYKPTHISIEDAFYNRLRPNAYGSLLQCICTLSLLCRDKYYKPLYRVPTRLAKLTTCGKGNASKDDVIAAVMDHEFIKFDNNPQNNLATHEADAIAVGYHAIINVISNQ